jgi:hypothetical protein
MSTTILAQEAGRQSAVSQQRRWARSPFHCMLEQNRAGQF